MRKALKIALPLVLVAMLVAVFCTVAFAEDVAPIADGDVVTKYGTIPAGEYTDPENYPFVMFAGTDGKYEFISAAANWGSTSTVSSSIADGSGIANHVLYHTDSSNKSAKAVDKDVVILLRQSIAINKDCKLVTILNGRFKSLTIDLGGCELQMNTQSLINHEIKATSARTINLTIKNGTIFTKLVSSKKYVVNVTSVADGTADIAFNYNIEDLTVTNARCIFNIAKDKLLTKNAFKVNIEARNSSFTVADTASVDALQLFRFGQLKTESQSGTMRFHNCTLTNNTGNYTSYTTTITNWLHDVTSDAEYNKAYSCEETSFAGDCVTNNDGTHSATCVGECGLLDTPVNCTWDNTHKCTVCGYQGTHDYSLEKQTSEAVMEAGNCVTGTVYYKSCECTAISSTETFVGDVDASNHANKVQVTEGIVKSFEYCSACTKATAKPVFNTTTKTQVVFEHSFTVKFYIPTAYNVDASKIVVNDNHPITVTTETRDDVEYHVVEIKDIYADVLGTYWDIKYSFDLDGEGTTHPSVAITSKVSIPVYAKKMLAAASDTTDVKYQLMADTLQYAKAAAEYSGKNNNSWYGNVKDTGLAAYTAAGVNPTDIAAEAFTTKIAGDAVTTTQISTVKGIQYVLGSVPAIRVTVNDKYNNEDITITYAGGTKTATVAEGDTYVDFELEACYASGDFKITVGEESSAYNLAAYIVALEAKQDKLNETDPEDTTYETAIAAAKALYAYAESAHAAYEAKLKN